MSNPYLLDRPALISVSGGRTSGFMLRQIIDAFGGRLPEDVIPVFCNTGLEHEATYQFLNEMGKRWTGIQWLEYVHRGNAMSATVLVHNHTRRNGLVSRRRTRIAAPNSEQPLHDFRVVDFCGASRNGEPFAAAIQARKYLPNPITRFCTAELKIRTGDRFATYLGWPDYTRAVGLRADEPRRVAKMKGEGNETVVLPMAKAGHTIEDVRAFWRSQDFDLQLPGDDNAFGNCVGCFLKGRKKLDKVFRTMPEAGEWWARQEECFTDKEGRQATFRIDRPAYRQMLTQLTVQGQMFDDAIEDDTLPCNCTD